MVSKVNIAEEVQLRDVKVPLSDNENEKISVQGIQKEIASLKESNQHEISSIKETMLKNAQEMYLEIANLNKTVDFLVDALSENCGTPDSPRNIHKRQLHTSDTRFARQRAQPNIAHESYLQNPQKSSCNIYVGRNFTREGQQKDQNNADNGLLDPINYQTNMESSKRDTEIDSYDANNSQRDLEIRQPDSENNPYDVENSKRDRKCKPNDVEDESNEASKGPNDPINRLHYLDSSPSTTHCCSGEQQSTSYNAKNDIGILHGIPCTKQNFLCQPQKLSTQNDPTLDCNHSSGENIEVENVSTNLYLSYCNSFTIHGLSRVFNGRLWEKFLWAIVLLASFIFVGHATYGFIQEYRSFRVKTDIQVVSAKEITFPAVTLCAAREINFDCYFDENCHQVITDIYSAVIPQDLKYIINHPDFPYLCIIINPYGNLTARTFPQLRFDRYLVYLSFHVHDHRDAAFVLGLLVKKERQFLPGRCSVLSFTNKQLISRLPSPYQSHCNDNKERINMFPGPYSWQKCQNTCIFKRMYSECGEVIRPWQKYLKKTQIQNSSEGLSSCLYYFIRNKLDDMICDCPLSCEEINVDVTDNIEESDNRKFRCVKFEYLSKTYTEISEVPAYPASKFITDIGGWLSLFTGMSALSLLEMFVFIPIATLIIWKKFM